MFCEACGGDLMPWLTMPLDAKKNERTTYSAISKCSRCGCGRLASLPRADEIPEFYELSSYYTHGQTHIRDVAPSLADKVLTRLAWSFDHGEAFDVHRIAQSLPIKARICDLGCGHALYLRELKALGFDVIGVEPDPSARKQAAAANVIVLEGTAENPPELSGKFDLVLCTHALEHCRNARTAIENAYNLTKEGGLCYIEVPNCDCEHFRTFTICSENFDAPRHIWFFTPDSLAQLAERVGFTVRKRLFIGYTRNFSPSWRAWETEIAARLSRLGVRAKRHSFVASLVLFLRSFFKAKPKKYDSFGLILVR